MKLYASRHKLSWLSVSPRRLIIAQKFFCYCVYVYTQGVPLRIALMLNDRFFGKFKINFSKMALDSPLIEEQLIVKNKDRFLN